MKNVLKVLVCLMLVLSMVLSAVACNNEETEKPTDFSADAKAYVKQLYINKAVETASDYDVIGLVTIEGNQYVIDWTLEVLSGEANDVKLVKAEDGSKYTVDVNEKAEVATEYKLTATVKDSTHTVSFTHKVPVYKINTYEEYVANTQAGGTLSVVKGNVIAVISTESGSSSATSFYMQDANGYGYYVYKPASAEGLEYGVEVIVKGTSTVYNGMYEFEAGATVELTGKTLDTLAVKDATADFSAATSEKDAALLPYQNIIVELKGCKMANFDGAYYYFTIGDSDVKFNVYDNNYFLTEDERNAYKALWEAGKVCDIKGIVSVYSNVYQIYPFTADVVSNVSVPTLTDAEAVAFVKENLTISTTQVDKAATEIAVDTNGYGGQVAIDWTIPDGIDYITYAEGKITIVSLPDTKTTVKITATLTAGDVTDTKEFEIVVSASTINWISADYAIELCSALDAESKEISASAYYIWGEIIDDPTADYCNFHFTDGVNEIVVYGLYAPNGTDRYGTKRQIAELPVAKGDIVYLYGNLQNYKGTYEIVNAVLQVAGQSNGNPIDAAKAIEICSTLDAEQKEMTTDKYYIIGTIIDDPTADYCNFHFTDGENEIVVYGLWTADGANRYGSKREIAELPVANGDTVLLYGQLQNYKGTYEIVNACLMADGSSIANPIDAAKAIELCSALDAESKEISAESYYILATIVDDPTADYCNFNFSNGETQIKVYGLAHYDGANRYGSKREIAELPVIKGDTVLLYGQLQNYKGTLEVINARLVDIPVMAERIAE